ncbi:MAG: hypothetical protein C7B46_04330 [Sulfobacillus benefaciens]|uniref:Yip1 domain-containing protein n=1 Tax=Sulfobacillus benefaciens TaxID=453960 RepID=A0A2T2XJJ9_9FIRM|nr:MAG: hypothetical protein C7B46_04330 [Sulfobacillus benefaciens]
MNRFSPRRQPPQAAGLWYQFIRSPLAVDRLLIRHPGAALQTFYWSNLLWTAFIVSLGQVFSIPFPDRAFLHGIYGFILVLLGGVILLYPGMMVMDTISTRLGIYSHDATRRAILMAMSPWFIVIGAAFVLSPTFIVPAISLIVAMYVLVSGLVHGQRITWRDAAVTTAGLAIMLVGVLWIMFWLFGWDIYAV